jgi:hypothetical protein
MPDDSEWRQVIRDLIDVQRRICDVHLRLLEAHLLNSQTEAIETAQRLTKMLTDNQEALEAHIQNLHIHNPKKAT